jgi:GTPase
MKVGTVLLVGRTNAGKSTLLNSIVGQKVAITTRKPQTTRFPISAVFEDERGQIIFTDTPGIYAKSPDVLSKKVSKSAEESFKDSVDVVAYLIDHTRYRDTEENKAIGLVRKIKGVPKILVFNKWDIKEPTYYPVYRFLEEEFDEVVKLSSTKGTHIKRLLEIIFDYLPERKDKLVDTSNLTSPLLNMDGRLFIEEIIREKAYNALSEELPYTINIKVNELEERDNGTLYINAGIITTDDRYKAMIVGRKGQKIKEIGTAIRKELEISRGGKKVFIELNVKVDSNWMVGLYG